MNSHTIDAKTFQKLFLAGANRINSRKDYINELNVFPVPDGDTGTNMSLTILAADEMHAGMQAGDSVLTTSGFYGVIIDIMDDTVIVEFGNNRNCRIPMQKDAIAAVEKPNLTKTEEE